MALLALGGSATADSIASGSTGSFYAIPSTASFAGNMTPYSGGPVNTANTQIPFWNNPSEDSLYAGHSANAGDVLAGLATNSNLIGSNLAGATGTLAGDSATQINGSYYAYAGGSDPVNTTGNATAETTALAFSFLSEATAYNIAVLFADSKQNTGLAPSATVFGYYTGSVDGSLNLTPLDGAAASDTTGSPVTLATDDTLEPDGSVYGFYVTVCYHVTGNVCTESVTYTTGAGNYSTNMSAGNAFLGALGYNHFALFELADGTEVVAVKDYPWALGNSNNKEGIGDFNDVMIELTPTTSVAPEPSSFGLALLGLAYFLVQRNTRLRLLRVVPKNRPA
jgi:hypothetical protein